jgi:anti-anti-sigma regulatory factor
MTQTILKLLCGHGYATNVGTPLPTAWPMISSPAVSTHSTPTPSMLSLVADSPRLTHSGAEALCQKIREAGSPRVIVVDLRKVEDITTAALAKLVLLRRELLRDGRDLRLKGLHSRAASVWRISKLSSVLPVQ